MKVAFIGLGIMGRGMARNLLDSVDELRVWNRSVQPKEELGKAGATVAASAAEAVQGADVVFTMLSQPEVVAELAWGKDGFLAQMKAGAIWVDSSTVNPSFAMEESAQASQHGVRFVNAPVAGTKPHAEKGELTFIMGGEAETIAAVKPLLAKMSVKQVHAGPMGHGSRLKILVNGMLAQAMLMFAEALNLGESLGLDKEFLLHFLPNTPVVPAFVKMKVEAMQTGRYEAQFPLQWMHKDLHLLSQTAYEQEQPMVLANVAKEVYAQAKKQGYGEQDFAAIYDFVAKK
jgi:3-hydroxyisobutyrate dehydrogenase